MKILVTGSSGSIGTRLCQKLIATKHEIIPVDWVENKWSTEINTKTIIVDLRDTQETLKVLPRDIDMIIHLAANARVYNLIDDPSLAKDNFLSLFSMLEFARVQKIQKFLFTSSREVYGDAHDVACTEDAADVQNSENPYTASKIGGEALVYAYHHSYGLSSIILRYANVYGMYDDSDRVIPLFLRRCYNNEDISIFGKGKVLDFTHIDDIIAGTLSAINTFDSNKNNAFNISCGVGTFIVDLANLIKDTLGSTSNIHIEENRVGEVMKSVVDISKAQEHLQFEPKVSISEGVVKAAEWYTTNLFSKRP